MWEEKSENGELVFKISTLIHSTTGYKINDGSQQKFDAPEENITDVVLLVEDRKVHFNKQAMAMHSKVFHNLFYSDPAQLDKKEFELNEDLEYEEFLDLLRHLPVFRDAQQEELEIQDEEDIAQGILNVAAPGNNALPTWSEFELAKHLFALYQIQQAAEGIAMTNAPTAYIPNSTATFGSSGTSSSSATGSSPSKTPKRPRDKKRDAETKELRNKVNEASWGTPIDLVFAGSPEFDERQREAVDRCKLAEVYQLKVYQLVPHLFHRHIFDPTATPTHIPQLKKNVMLDVRQLFGAWNFKTNGKDRGVSNKEWAELQDTEDPRLMYWYRVTEMLAKEKERQIIAGFIALDKPQKTRNYARKSEDGAGHAPPIDFAMVTGIIVQVEISLPTMEFWLLKMLRIQRHKAGKKLLLNTQKLLFLRAKKNFSTKKLRAIF